MKSKTIIIATASLGLMLLIPVHESLARQGNTRLTLRTGMIQNPRNDPDHFQYAPNPELELATRLFTRSAWSVSGGAYLGYWWDTVESAGRCQFCMTSGSVQALSAGMRFMFTMERTVFPVDWTVGAGRHYTYEKGFNDTFTALEVGLQARYPFKNRWEILGGGRLLISDVLGSNRGAHSWRPGFYMGTSYAF